LIRPDAFPFELVPSKSQASTGREMSVYDAATASSRSIRIPAPAKNLLRAQAMPTRHFRHDSARRQCLIQYPRFLIRRPTTAPARTIDYFKAMWNALRVKRKVKSRHKTIPNQRPSA
jgi:hypothetical protein